MWTATELTPSERAAGPRLKLVERFVRRGAFVRTLHDGRLLFRGGCWYFWDPRKNAIETSVGPIVDTRYAEDGSPDGKRLAYMVEDGVLLYEFAREGSVGRYDCDADERSVCRFSPDGRLLWFAYGENVGVVVVDTEEVHVTQTPGGCVELVQPHCELQTALLGISGGPHPSAVATFDGKDLKVAASTTAGSVAAFSPRGAECIVENEQGGYRFVEFPAGFAAPEAPASPASKRRRGALSRVDEPREFDHGRHHSAAYLTDRLLLELSIDQGDQPSVVTSPSRVAVLDRTMCTRTAAVVFTKKDHAEIVAFGEALERDGCPIDSVDALGGGFILTYDDCCGHRVWDARALCRVDA